MGCHFLLQVNLPGLGIEPTSLASPVLATALPGKSPIKMLQTQDSGNMGSDAVSARV